jgi:SAM-dependent methyltransferase
MGLDINGTRFLLYARKQGVDFSRTVMIGRQSLNLNAATLKRNLKDFGIAVTAAESERLILSENGYAESFLRLLGAAEIVSFDASDYEKATFIHDFNLPLDKKFFGRFSVVLDGGTLEHIFNFPQAISNCMQMVEPGGHLLCITPANNFLGHGFYQFSPEVFFRIFNPGNGFVLRQMLVFESPSTNWYEVIAPEVVRKRVTLINRRETYLLVIAQKTATVPIFATPIQQSDYTLLWEFSKLHSGAPAKTRAVWRSLVPAPLKWPVRIARGCIRAYRARPRLGFDGRHFRKVRVP